MWSNTPRSENVGRTGGWLAHWHRRNGRGQAGAHQAILSVPHNIEAASERATSAIGLGYAYAKNTDEAWLRERDQVIKAERLWQAAILRDIFGIPHRQGTIQHDWLHWHNGIVLTTAREAYDHRHFAELCVLADALEEAVCTQRDVLEHCRQKNEHVHGCWVVDLLLQKE